MCVNEAQALLENRDGSSGEPYTVLKGEDQGSCLLLRVKFQFPAGAELGRDWLALETEHAGE